MLHSIVPVFWQRSGKVIGPYICIRVGCRRAATPLTGQLSTESNVANGARCRCGPTGRESHQRLADVFDHGNFYTTLIYAHPNFKMRIHVLNLKTNSYQ